MTRQAPTRRALSWPGPPNGNPCIDKLAELFNGLGFPVEHAHPVALSTGWKPADLFLIHWPDAVCWGQVSPLRVRARMAATLANLHLLRARGVRIIWFAHNLEPHDLPGDIAPLWNGYWRRVRSLLHGWLTLSPSTVSVVSERFSDLAALPHGHVIHPRYDTAATPDRWDTRAALEVERGDLLFAHVGQLRAFKQLIPWVHCFQDANMDPSRLLLAGRSLRGEGERLAAMATANTQVALGHLDADRYRGLLSACDVFLAPYGNFLHSGALVHALGQGCVCIAPETPFTRDLADAVGSDWIVFCQDTPDDSILRTAAQRARDLAGTRPSMDAFSQAANRDRLAEFLQRAGWADPGCGRQGPNNAGT